MKITLDCGCAIKTLEDGQVDWVGEACDAESCILPPRYDWTAWLLAWIEDQQRIYHDARLNEEEGVASVEW
ncbi:MAG: hypothetical protein V3V08_23410 [Nannocystaceae bacterium]